MAGYKVPQDVEADDKILGPFSFRQFIYLIIVAISIGLAWFLGQLFIPLAIIPMPIVIFFGALALPLRKDQPMETYLAAMVTFYLKPRRRLWEPDGINSLIEITVPKIPEVQRVKDITQDEAQRRLTYLSEIVDSQGWAIKGVTTQQAPDSSMVSDVYFAAQQTKDILDDDNSITRMFDDKLEKSNTYRKNAMAKVISGQPTDYFNNQITETIIQPSEVVEEKIKINFDPYPDIQQSVIQPLGEKSNAKPPTALSLESAPKIDKDIPTTSVKTPSADIMKLAINDDLSIATIAREANRIHEKQELKDGIVISWR